MTFTELIAEVAKEAKLPRWKVAPVLKAFIIVTRRALLSGSDVRLRGFGAFYTVVLKDRALFGGTAKQKRKPRIRFRESRHGEVQRTGRGRGKGAGQGEGWDEDSGLSEVRSDLG